MPKLYVMNSNGEEDQVLDCNPALSLFNNLGMQGVGVETLCGGKGNCGMCRVKVLNPEEVRLSPKKKSEKVLLEDLLEEGWRLSCQTYSLKDVKLRLPDYDQKEALPKQRKLGN